MTTLWLLRLQHGRNCLAGRDISESRTLRIQRRKLSGPAARRARCGRRILALQRLPEACSLLQRCRHRAPCRQDLALVTVASRVSLYDSSTSAPIRWTAPGPSAAERGVRCGARVQRRTRRGVRARKAVVARWRTEWSLRGPRWFEPVRQHRRRGGRRLRLSACRPRTFPRRQPDRSKRLGGRGLRQFGAC